MHNANDLLRLLKLSSNEANEALYPATVMFGEVISVSPLKVYVEQRFQLTSEQLIVADHLSDKTFEGTMKIDGVEHTVEMNYNNALRTSDKVVLIRQHGGQKFFVADRVV